MVWAIVFAFLIGIAAAVVIAMAVVIYGYNRWD